MARHVRRGSFVYKKRGRPSRKKQLRGLAIFFAMAIIGSISGGVGTVTTKKRVTTEAAWSPTTSAWIVLTVVCVLLLIIVAWLYRKRFVDQAERINSLIDNYQATFQVANTTTSVATYMNAMQQLGKMEKIITEREGELPNWAKKRVKTIAPEQKGAQRYYQWWLRNVIDRAKTAAVKECKGTFKNSNEDRERIYWEFINNVYAGNPSFDRETVDFANASAMAVYRASGSFFTPRAPFVIEDDNRTRKSNKQSVDSLLLQVDSMSGKEFERFCSELLRKNGFTKVKLTQASGDQGVDILAEKSGVQYAVQCKCYSSDLGNTPVQEVNAGRTIYGCHVGVVLTNRYFTRGAKEAAAQTNVLLWDRDTLIDLMRNV